MPASSIAGSTVVCWGIVEKPISTTLSTFTGQQMRARASVARCCVPFDMLTVLLQDTLRDRAFDPVMADPTNPPNEEAIAPYLIIDGISEL